MVQTTDQVSMGPDKDTFWRELRQDGRDPVVDSVTETKMVHF